MSKDPNNPAMQAVLVLQNRETEAMGARDEMINHLRATGGPDHWAIEQVIIENLDKPTEEIYPIYVAALRAQRSQGDDNA